MGPLMRCLLSILLVVGMPAAGACLEGGDSPASPSGLPASSAECPGGIVGDPGSPPAIQIVGLRPGAARVSGVATNIDARTTKVVLWAKTDRWYVQPFVAAPFTQGCSEGSWSATTHPWDRMVALLVNESYSPGATRQSHPAGEPGVVAWDEYPSAAADRYLEFGGLRWRVKDADLAGPGPNAFSSSASTVWVADDGLHLRIESRDGRWYSAEVVAERALGHGVYTFQVTSRVDQLDFQIVFAGFVYEDEGREIDIEFSRGLAAPSNSQFVVQPFTRSGNLHRFTLSDAPSSHRFVWRPDRIDFVSWRGLGAEPRANTIIRSWTYRGPDIPPAGGERMRFNLWLLSGRPPRNGQPGEVVVRSFRFSRLVREFPG